jgi:hypothetical protein
MGFCIYWIVMVTDLFLEFQKKMTGEQLDYEVNIATFYIYIIRSPCLQHRRYKIMMYRPEWM